MPLLLILDEEAPSGGGALTGTSSGTSATTGALNVAKALGGSSVGTSTTTGVLGALRALAGTSSSAATDSFTDADNTDLAAHVGEGSITWAKHPSYTADARINSGRVRPVSTNVASLHIASAVPTSADYDVVGNFNALTLAERSLPALCGRIDPAADTYYMARVDTATGAHKVQLFKQVAGASTSLGIFNTTFSTGPLPEVVLRMRGSQISVLVDGTAQISATDSAITQAGRWGVRTGQVTNVFSTTGVHIESAGWMTDSSTTQGSLGVTAGLTGTSAGASTTTGVAAATFALSGTSTGTSTTVGGFAGDSALTATSTGTSSSAGALAVTRPLTGTTTGTSTTTGAARLTVALGGTSAGQATTAGAVRASWALSGSDSGTSTTLADLTVQTPGVTLTGILEGLHTAAGTDGTDAMTFIDADTTVLGIDGAGVLVGIS